MLETLGILSVSCIAVASAVRLGTDSALHILSDQFRHDFHTDIVDLQSSLHSPALGEAASVGMQTVSQMHHDPLFRSLLKDTDANMASLMAPSDLEVIGNSTRATLIESMRAKKGHAFKDWLISTGKSLMTDMKTKRYEMKRNIGRVKPLRIPAWSLPKFPNVMDHFIEVATVFALQTPDGFHIKMKQGFRFMLTEGFRKQENQVLFMEMLGLGVMMQGQFVEAGLLFVQNTGPDFPTITRRVENPYLMMGFPKSLLDGYLPYNESVHFHPGFKDFVLSIHLTSEGPDLGSSMYSIGPGLRIASNWRRDMETKEITHSFDFPFWISTERASNPGDDLPFYVDWRCGSWYPPQQLCKSWDAAIFWPSRVANEMSRMIQGNSYRDARVSSKKAYVPEKS